MLDAQTLNGVDMVWTRCGHDVDTDVYISCIVGADVSSSMTKEEGCVTILNIIL